MSKGDKLVYGMEIKHRVVGSTASVPLEQNDPVSSLAEDSLAGAIAMVNDARGSAEPMWVRKSKLIWVGSGAIP